MATGVAAQVRRTFEETMSLIEKIQALGIAFYEETLTVPTRLVLPLAAHDKLKAECAARIAQKASVVPGTISCIQIETGYGVIEVVTAVPEPARRARAVEGLGGTGGIISEAALGNGTLDAETALRSTSAQSQEKP